MKAVANQGQLQEERFGHGAVSGVPKRGSDMLTGSLLWLIGIPIPIVLLVWFFFLRGR